MTTPIQMVVTVGFGGGGSGSNNYAGGGGGFSGGSGKYAGVAYEGVPTI